MTLKVSDGKLFSRDWGCPCRIGTDDPEDEDAARLANDLQSVVRILSKFQITETEVEELIATGDRSKAGLWSPDDEGILVDIARAWTILFRYGIEPCDIRRVLHRRSSQLWNKPPKRLASLRPR